MTVLCDKGDGWDTTNYKINPSMSQDYHYQVADSQNKTARMSSWAAAGHLHLEFTAIWNL